MTKSKKRVGVLTLIIVITVCFLRLGYWIVDTDEPQKADVIWVLMGSYGERALLAVDLYNAHIADKIVVAQPYNEQEHLLEQNGIFVTSDENIFSYILTRKGVDSSAITVIPGNAINTIAEAKSIVNYCRDHPNVKSICVVTSTYHSGRARKIINDALEENDLKIKISFPNNTYTDYKYKRWYLRQKDILTTVSETTKTFYYLLWAQW